jgi:hypothetical protein
VLILAPSKRFAYTPGKVLSLAEFKSYIENHRELKNEGENVEALERGS